VIGYYVHHHGSGHLHRALALSAHLEAAGEQVTILSSLEPPAGHQGPWVVLPLDADPGVVPASAADVTAHGTLHWVPLGHDGLLRRSAAVSAWLREARPRLVVSDVSQEVTLLCRLHGVAVLSVVLPGRRDDAAHRTGLGASTALCSFWPPAATSMLPGVPAALADRVVALGAMARYTPAPSRSTSRAGAGPRRLVVVGGRGGASWTAQEVQALRAAATGWEVTVLGAGDDWVDDPWAVLCDADVVVVQPGQNALAEVAAARVPALVVAGERPFDEQVTTAAQVDAGPWPARSLPRLVHDDWPTLLDEVAALDGETWSTWCDGGAAERFARLVRSVAP
jgi:hypothetical protein